MRMGKRICDVIMAGVGLILFLPVGIVIACVLRMTGEGEVFYRQDRVGRGGRKFKLIKFATMLKASPRMGPGYLPDPAGRRVPAEDQAQ